MTAVALQIILNITWFYVNNAASRNQKHCAYKRYLDQQKCWNFFLTCQPCHANPCRKKQKYRTKNDYRYQPHRFYDSFAIFFTNLIPEETRYNEFNHNWYRYTWFKALSLRGLIRFYFCHQTVPFPYLISTSAYRHAEKGMREKERRGGRSGFIEA